jgi:purine-binding chemotaxis protein CheW
MTTELKGPGKRGIDQLAGKYLTFVLDGQSYGVDVLQVREIIRRPAITAVPEMPPYVRGVINLRGKIIPVIDLRLRFGLAEASTTEQTCIVVVLVQLSADKTSQMGIIVDGVEEVAQIAASEIEAAPDFGGESSAGSLLGMAKLKSGLKALLDLDQIIGGEKGDRVAATALAQQPTASLAGPQGNDS